jgi:hypothetical protein
MRVRVARDDNHGFDDLRRLRRRARSAKRFSMISSIISANPRFANASISRIVHRPLPTDDPKQRQPDISRAKNVMGWEPRVALKDSTNDNLFRSIAIQRELRAQLLKERIRRAECDVNRP